LLALLLLAALIGIPLWLRARGREQRWTEEFDAAAAEVTWLCRTVIPQLQQQSPSTQVAGGWAVALPRVVAAEDKLTALESSAPDQDHAARARVVRDGLRSAHTRLDSVAQSVDPAVISSELAGTAASLEQVIDTVTPSSPPGPPSS
jgi:hypothetical protein